MKFFFWIFIYIIIFKPFNNLIFKAESIDKIERLSQTGLSQLDNYLSSIEDFESSDESEPAPSKKRARAESVDEIVSKKNKRGESDEDQHSDRESKSSDESESDY